MAFCTYLGYLCGGKYRKKKSFFFSMEDFNEKFLNELAFSRRPLADFIGMNEYKGDFACSLKSFLSEGKPKTYSFLTDEEKGFVEAYFSVLGKGDAHSQNGYFSSAKENLASYKENSEALAKKYCDMYLKLGFLLGLALLIVIV